MLFRKRNHEKHDFKKGFDWLVWEDREEAERKKKDGRGMGFGSFSSLFLVLIPFTPTLCDCAPPFARISSRLVSSLPPNAQICLDQDRGDMRERKKEWVWNPQKPVSTKVIMEGFV